MCTDEAPDGGMRNPGENYDFVNTCTEVTFNNYYNVFFSLALVNTAKQGMLLKIIDCTEIAIINYVVNWLIIAVCLSAIYIYI